MIELRTELTLRDLRGEHEPEVILVRTHGVDFYEVSANYVAALTTLAVRVLGWRATLPKPTDATPRELEDWRSDVEAGTDFARRILTVAGDPMAGFPSLYGAEMTLVATRVPA